VAVRLLGSLASPKMASVIFAIRKWFLQKSRRRRSRTSWTASRKIGAIYLQSVHKSREWAQGRRKALCTQSKAEG
jgi:hypothetical protein